MRPLHDRVVVARAEAESVSEGGLIIPETAKEKPARGTVMAVGSGRLDKDGRRITLDVSVGDRVLFGKYAGTDVEIHGEPVVILREEEILAVLDA